MGRQEDAEGKVAARRGRVGEGRERRRCANQEKVALARAEIEARYRQRVKVEDLARRVRLSAPELSRQFRRFEGVTPLQYLIRLRMKDAARLLQNSNARIVDVAARVGYLSRTAFVSVFCRHCGAVPSRLPGKRRARKDKGVVRAWSLGSKLAEVLQGKGIVSIAEAIEAVLAAGYKTKARNFSSMVSDTLAKDKRFRRVHRGVYALKA